MYCNIYQYELFAIYCNIYQYKLIAINCNNCNILVMQFNNLVGTPTQLPTHYPAARAPVHLQAALLAHESYKE